MDIKKIRGKRGISPVVATVLLITIAVVVIAIIFIWARSVLREQETKFGDPVSDACNNVNLLASSSGSTLSISNRGNVPIKGVNIKDSGGEITLCEISSSAGQSGLSAGQSATEDCGISDPVSIIPIVETDAGEDYSCSDNEIEL